MVTVITLTLCVQRSSRERIAQVVMYMYTSEERVKRYISESDGLQISRFR